MPPVPSPSPELPPTAAAGSVASTQIPVLHHLRGLAALLVCLFHFSNGTYELLPASDGIRKIGSFGWLGVGIFFVISGFIIPYSLHLRAYRAADAGDFVIRRLKRLEPPYFACIGVIIALHWCSSHWGGLPSDALVLSWPQLLAHAAYLNSVLDFPWVNPVFWTLALEFQFYLFMAVAFPLLNHERQGVRAIAILAVAALGLIGFRNSALLLHWLPLFAIGILTYQVYCERLSRSLCLALAAMILPIAALNVGVQQTLAGAAAALLIWAAADRQPYRVFTPLAMIGTISYSLYLVHSPIGDPIIRFSLGLPEAIPHRYAALAAALAASLLFASVFWWLVERPSHCWAKRQGALQGRGGGRSCPDFEEPRDRDNDDSDRDHHCKPSRAVAADRI